ncbi:MAG: ATP-binding cassette domain-containing protein, partial [Candidatus Nanohaloarchaea archaeon]|nr:ATP-binding cassette domain-containing protein [Candidatus Nanohaloarchaea archaeon]
MSKIADLRDVVKTYRRGDGQVVALDNVDLDVEEGTLTAVVGPSGSGKTSLLNVIGALDTPDAGEVVVADEHVEDMDEAALTAFRRETVGFVFQ